MASLSLQGLYHQSVRYYVWEHVCGGEYVHPLKVCGQKMLQESEGMSEGEPRAWGRQ